MGLAYSTSCCAPSRTCQSLHCYANKEGFVANAMKRHMYPDGPEPIVESREYASALDYTQAVRDAYVRLRAENPPMAESVCLCLSEGLTQRAAAARIGVSAKTVNLRRAAGLERIASWCDVHPERVTYELENGAICEVGKGRNSDTVAV